MAMERKNAVDANPNARFSYSLAYDESNQKVILFGGFAPGVKFNDTWAWDGKNWELLGNDGPCPRDSAAIAYDASRECVYAFGGHTFDDRFENDTWQWKDNKWTQLTVTSPPARNHSSMIYFPPIRKIVLFGGRSKQKDLGDTWAWNGAEWKQLDVAGPSPRDGYRMIYDSARQKIILFGGRSRAGNHPSHLRDTWEFDGAAWIQVCNSGPPARSHHGMFYEKAGGRTFLFGGESSSIPYFADAWFWDGNLWEKTDMKIPSPRSRVFVSPSLGGKALLFGGKGELGPFQDTWQWENESSWKMISSQENDINLSQEHIS